MNRIFLCSIWVYSRPDDRSIWQALTDILNSYPVILPDVSLITSIFRSENNTFAGNAGVSFSIRVMSIIRQAMTRLIARLRRSAVLWTRSSILEHPLQYPMPIFYAPSQVFHGVPAEVLQAASDFFFSFFVEVAVE